jgi:hypothetical protein
MASLRQHDESAEKENSQRLVTLLGLDGKTISPTSYRPWGAICLDIPFYRTGLPETYFSRTGPHSVYNDVDSVKTHFSVHLPGSAFSLTRNLFPATKVRARIVRWNRLSSTSHLFDPDPRRDHDSLFELPNALGRQDAQSRSRS